jgi:hypothetical protein
MHCCSSRCCCGWCSCCSSRSMAVWQKQQPTCWATAAPALHRCVHVDTTATCVDCSSTGQDSKHPFMWALQLPCLECTTACILCQCVCLITSKCICTARSTHYTGKCKSSQQHRVC